MKSEYRVLTLYKKNKKTLDSLWSLVSLASWSFDYLRWILREWNMLFNRIRPHNSSKLKKNKTR
jgi:hypothetical protein